MSDTKHTKGPWEARRLRDNWGQSYATSYIAHIDIGPCMIWAPEGNEEQEANAHLIAAAPDMLAELERIVVYLDRVCFHEDSEARARIVAVISKAKGEA
jgi:hypothetical protein